MIISIDGYEANVKNRVGIGRYAFEILTHLYPLVGRSGHRANIYLPSAPSDDMPKEAPWWHYRVAQPSKLWTFIGLPYALRTDQPRADVMFSPTHYVPRFTTIPRVMSVMDLSYLEYPEMFRPKDLHQLTQWTAYSIRHSAKILTISEFSKNAIIQWYNVPSDRVVVTHLGFTKMVNHSGSHQPKKSYILSVGTIQPRKNFTRLIEAFAKAQIPNDIELLIVGKKGWLYEDIISSPKRLGIEDRVRFLDFVPDTDLPSLYSDAVCFALPSLYEGFGLPVLEAMAYGTQVVISNVSSLPEIAGKAGIYVDPNDTESIAKGLEKAVEEQEKKAGKDRITEGKVQVKKFTWEKAAKDTLAVLEEVGKGKA